jgi:hypothetical protein
MSGFFLPCSFSVTSTDYQVDTDSCLNIYRRRENVFYKQDYDAKNAAVSFLSNDFALASSVVSVVDKSSSLITNRSNATGNSIVIKGVSSYIFKTDKVWVTDQIIILADSTQVSLFFQHIISTDNVPRSSGYSLDSGVVLTSVKILDKDFREISIQEKNVDFDKGIVYNNLKNNIDSDDIFFVQYSVRIDNDIFTYVEILNNQEIYSQATFDDLDEDLNIINDGRKVYVVNYIGNEFEFVLPTSGDYGFLVKDVSKIKILPFDSLRFDFPWFTRISNGSFYAVVNNETYKYSIAQFSEQLWNPENPYKRISNEFSSFLSKNLVALNRNNIYENNVDSLYIDILVNDKYNNGLAAFTTNLSLSETIASNGVEYIYWTFTNKIGIRSVDYLNGLVDIEGYDLDSSYIIRSSYYYEEKDFEFSGVDLNPVNNQSILQQKLVLFIDPETVNQSKTKTLYYLLVDKTNKVIESDWTSFNNNTQRLTSGHILYYSGVPSFVTPEDSYKVFLDTYTVEGVGVFLTIGESIVDINIDTKDVDSRDMRIAAGGVVESKVSAAKRENPETIWYWDIGRWDGEAYPGNASYFVEVPVSVFSGAGGTFTQQQVKDIVNKHTAFGVYSIVKAYGVDPFATDIEPRVNSILVSWPSYNADVYFNIYYSKKSDGPWTKANSSLINNDSSGNSYEITGLQTEVEYYVMIIGGELDNTGVFVAQCGQSVGPFDYGINDFYNMNIVRARTFGVDISGTFDFSNTFEVI